MFKKKWTVFVVMDMPQDYITVEAETEEEALDLAEERAVEDGVFDGGSVNAISAELSDD